MTKIKKYDSCNNYNIIVIILQNMWVNLDDSSSGSGSNDDRVSIHAGTDQWRQLCAGQQWDRRWVQWNVTY